MTAHQLDPSTTFYGMPFVRTLGLELVGATKEGVSAKMPWSDERCTSGGILHGGALMALADSAGAMAAFLHLPADATGTTTVESKTNFFRSVREGHVEAVARPLHAGR